MNFYSKLISCLLLLSVALNGYLLWPKEPQKPEDDKVKQSSIVTVKNQPENILTPAQEAFSKHQFEQAGNAYLTLKSTFPVAADDLYTQWLKQVKSWIHEGNLVPVEQFLNVFLARRPYDTTLLHLDAERQLKQGETHNAIVSLYSLYSLADTPLKAQLNSQIIQVTTNQLKQLTAQQAWQTMINQVLIWLDYDNEKPRYLLALATAYYHLDNMVSAEATLERMPPEHGLKNEAEHLQTLIDNKNTGIDLISLTKQGSHYLVDAQLNESINTMLMLDTGASYTVLPYAVFTELSPAPEQLESVMVNTANGQVQAQHYRIETIIIGNQRLSNFDVLVIENHSGYGLLGMNFLNQFKFNINQQTNQLELTQED